jgi:hypothetical protein
MSADFGMPTRTELNGVHKKLHELRREVRNGRSAESSREIDELRAEVRELKRAMSERGAEREKAPVPKPAPVKHARPPRAAAASRVANPVERIQATSSQKKRPSRKAAAKRATAERSHTRSVSVHAHAPLSFADAIKAMRRTVAKKTAKRKPAAAVAQFASKSSPILKRKRRRSARSR